VVARSGEDVLTVRQVERWIATAKRHDVGAFAPAAVGTGGTYQALGRAGAADDSLSDSATVARALEPQVVAARLERWLALEADGWVRADSSQYRGRYAAGDPLAAKDVSFDRPAAAAAFRAAATPATFEALARRSTGHYEELGVFKPGRLAPVLEQAIRATPPGRISGVIRTPFGTHVMYRPTFAEVRVAIIATDRPITIAREQKAYIAAVDSLGGAQLAPGALAIVRAVATDPDAHATDSSVIASGHVGKLTAERLGWWLAVFPPAMASSVRGAPDSALRTFVANIVGYEVMLRSADSAQVTVDSAAMRAMRRGYATSLAAAWKALRVDPRMLAGGRRAPEARQREAARRVNAYLDSLVAPTKRTRFVAVAPAVERALARRYPATIDSAAVRAIVASRSGTR
jgi:hypothetical protein